MMPHRSKVLLTSSILLIAYLLIAVGFANSPSTHASVAAQPDRDLSDSSVHYDQPTQSAEELKEIELSQRAGPTATYTRTPTPINIGNFVWDDLDHDGRQDAGEPGLAGVNVQLWNSTKTALLDTAVTNSSGIYTVTAPVPGDYRIRVLLPSPDDEFSPKDQAGGDNQLDSDINPTGTNFGFTDIFNLATNVISTTIHDAGIIIYRPPTPTRTPTPINVGNFVWNDLNGDGNQTAGEAGLVGITVQLWNGTKTSLIDQTTTGASGQYKLVAPLPGDYRVRVLLPTGASFTLKDQGSDLLDNDINPTGVNFGFTDIYTFGSNLISITSIDAGLTSVPPTPTFTYTFTPSNTPPPDVTPSNTPTANVTPSITPTEGSSGFNFNDTVALYSKKLQLFSLVDTLQAVPPADSYMIFVSSSPEKGKFIMGDWDGDGQKTPGLFKEKLFWYTNDIGDTAAWSEVKIGDFGKITVVAGRFDNAFENDCVGVVQMANVPYGHSFALHYTCELTTKLPPSGILTQWIDITLNGDEKYQFVAGDWNGDGLDSIAVRRGKKIKWGNTTPSQGAASFTGTQKFTTPNDSNSAILGGDWNGDGIDTFGLYFKGEGAFYYRDDLDKAKLIPALQSLGLPVGKAVASSWRKTTVVNSSQSLVPLP
jgi:hypothetical protein